MENLKDIILISEVEKFSNFEESLIVKQELQGPCQIFAKDLNFSVSFSLRNPNLYIGTIDFKEILELHLVLEPNKQSSVQKVNFKVEENPGKKISEQMLLTLGRGGGGAESGMSGPLLTSAACCSPVVACVWGVGEGGTVWLVCMCNAVAATRSSTMTLHKSASPSGVQSPTHSLRQPHTNSSARRLTN